MFWPKNLLPDPERFLVERFGFGVLAHVMVQHGQVIEAVAPCRDVLAQAPFAGSGALRRKSGSALAYSPIALVQLGQVIEAVCGVGMIWPKRFFRIASARW